MEALTPAAVDALVRAAGLRSERRPIEDVLRDVCEAARDVTGARYAALGVLGSDDRLDQFHHVGLTAGEVEGIGNLPSGRGVLGLIIRDPRPLRLEDLREHPATSGIPQGHPPMGSFLGVPIRIAGEVYGNLYLTDKDGGFSDLDEALVQILAAQAAAAIQTRGLLEKLQDVAIQGERDRIARDLHDRTIQSLFAIGMSLEASLLECVRDPGAAQAKVDAAVGQIDDVINVLRSTINDLDGDEGARQRLLRVVRSHELATGVRPRLQHTSELDDLVSAEMASDLAAIVGEALSNIARHAAATMVVVTVEADDDEVTVEVRDDGVGFDPSSLSAGHGLENLRERADLYDGTMTIESGAGDGTTITFRLQRRSGGMQ